MKDNNPDTKNQIFTTALRLFSSNGYENVTVRDIANAVGIKAASIYNHYESKENILQACYDFYLKNRYLERPEKDHYEAIIKNGTKEEVMNILNYTFESSIYENMVFAVFIIYARVYTDSKAREIHLSELNDSMHYLKEVFEFGIKNGRFDSFNVPAISLIIMSARLFTGQSARMKPEEKPEWHNAQKDFFSEFEKMIPFRY